MAKNKFRAPAYTPGPWIADTWLKMKNQGDVPTRIAGAGVPFGRKIAQLNFDVHDKELCDTKVWANSVLITNAPEMYETISKLAKHLVGKMQEQNLWAEKIGKDNVPKVEYSAAAKALIELNDKIEYELKKYALSNQENSD